MLRFLVVGAGAFARVHLGALARLGIVPLAYDPDPAARAALPGVAFVDTLAVGLAACDAAIIATPPATHAQIAEAVLRAGRDVFLEKPATETAADSAALAELAQETGRIVQVGMYFRFHPKTRALHRMIGDGTFGRVFHISARMSGLKRARGDSGAMLNDAVHFADLIPFLIGEAPARVFAMMQDPLERGREDLCTIQLAFPSGATALIEAGCVVPGEHDDSIVRGAETRKLLAVSGSKALAELDYAAERLVLRRGGHRPDGTGAWLPDHAPREYPNAPALDAVGVVAAQLVAFMDSIATRSPQGPGLIDGGVAPLRIMDAARRSAMEGRMVEI